MTTSPYDLDLDRNPANYQPLTPLQFLERSATVFPIIWRSSTARFGVPTRSSMRARGDWPRRWRSAGSARATLSP